MRASPPLRAWQDPLQRIIDIILHYFDNRTTNASAESFNAKLKTFRSVFRGVRDTTFFLYRVMKLYA
ncbi:MAG: transposase [Sphingobacterium hotanense]